MVLVGQTNVSFDIQIINDNIYEQEEKFVLTIDQSSTLSGVLIGSPNTTTIAIIDNDCKCKWCCLFIYYVVVYLYECMFN